MKSCAIVVGFDYWHESPDWSNRFCHALADYNPDLKVLVVDNFSAQPYTSNRLEIIRIPARVGYGPALNRGLKHLGPNYDWYLCFNNDCQILDGTPENFIPRMLMTYDEDTLYGSGVNQDTRLSFAWQWSAWLVISRKILQDIGYFDDQLSAAFEDFDYEYRAMLKGYKLATAELPIYHLDKHTRYEDPTYAARWEQSRLYFEQKHRLQMMKWYTDNEILKAQE